MKRFYLNVIRSILFILILIVVGYAWLNTQTGLVGTLWLISKIVPGKLTIEHFSGRLTGPIYFTNLSYENNDLTFVTDQLTIDWKLQHLIQQQLAIKNLSISHATLIIKPILKPTDSASDFSLQSIIGHIKLSKAQIQQLLVQYRSTRLRLSGVVDQEWQINWQANIPDLKELKNDLVGQVTVRGKINGVYQKPQLFVQLDRNHILFNHWQINNLQASLHLDVNPLAWNLKLNVPAIQNKNTRIHPVNIRIDGKLTPFFLRARISPINLQHLTESDELLKLNLPSSSLQSANIQQGLHTEFKFDTQRFVNLDASLDLPHYSAQTLPASNQPLRGKAHLLLRNLNYLNLALPRFKNLRGTLNADFNLSGTVASPRLTGQTTIQNASGQIPELGLLLQNIQISALFNSAAIQWLGSLKSGNGQLTLNGTTQLKPKNFPTVVTLTGKNLTVSNSRRYKITATTNLKINADTQFINVTGNIHLPYARIKLGGAEEGNVVDLSKDVVFVDQKASTSDAIKTASNIHLSFGDDIKFHYEGLHTYLRGALNIIEQPSQPTIGRGQIIFVNGHYKYYGKSLALKEGSNIVFTNGPIDNPTLNVTATKIVEVIPQSLNLRLNNTTNTNTNIAPGLIAAAAQSAQPIKVTVGLRVRGYAQNPQFTLFSEPAILIQTDILSYLLVDQPATELGAAGTQLLFNAATNLSDLKSITKSLQQGIGLDTLSIQNTSYVDPTTNTLAQNSSLQLGKALSPHLYINYSIGLLQPVNILQISYLINKYFSVQSTSSTFANGIDLLYKLEK